MTGFYAPATFAQIKDFSNRIEGTGLPHGDADMQLLGVVRSPINFVSNNTLRVHFFVPRDTYGQVPTLASTVSVEAREIIPIRNYLMRSKTAQWHAGAWNDFGPWPTGDILDPLGIQSNNLAVLASYRLADGSRVYLPVDVSNGGQPSSGSFYTFQFSTSYDLHALDKELINPSGNIETLPSSQCSASLVCILYGADSAHAFSVDMKNRPEGVYRLHLVGHVPNSSFRPQLSIEVYHSRT